MNELILSSAPAGTYLTFFFALMALVNPFNKIPEFLKDTSECSSRVRRGVAIVLSEAVFGIIVVAFFIGKYILEIFSISIPAFRIAGGLIVAFYGFKMVAEKTDIPVCCTTRDSDSNWRSYDIKSAKSKISDVIVPLGVPLIVGPGTLTTVILYGNMVKTPETLFIMIGLILVAVVIMGIVFYFSDQIRKFVGDNGLKIIARVMGLLLVALGVQFFITGTGEVIEYWLEDGFVSG
ncbi:multiple antibiotic resistance protein [Methanomicrobium sp. W14]|uniref:MarC family protein n=1 Tax=Methanomicrobium sp. W14 TaxID=2817839 RepID=UPI001AEA9B4F|nr:MarC family protein [Methanomicrobium sp. W14]MBP2134035.1 multiple antibiotic resistance protein [Methanomicrobium sp. W14]